MKLRITNFQSIEKAELEFPVGISTIVGSSNSGKTGCIRAIYSVLKNPSEAKSFIKHKTNKAEVSLETENVYATWTRTSKDSTYTLNGENLQKVGKTDLINLTSTGFCEDTEGDLINIQDEWSLLFPFNRTDSEVYKLFEDVFAINDSSKVLKEIKDCELNTKRELAKLKEDVSVNSNKLESIESFLQSYNEDELINLRNELVRNLDESKLLESDTGLVMDSLKTISKITKTDKIDLDFKESVAYISLVKDVDYLKNVIDIVKSEPTKVNIDFESVQSFIGLDNDTNIVLNSINKIDKCTLELPHLEFKDSLEFIKISEDSTSVLNMLKDISSMQTELKHIVIDLSNIKEKLSSVKTCPLCNQTTNEGVN